MCNATGFAQRLNTSNSSSPILRNPTISPLFSDEWVAVETIIEERQVRKLIPELKRLGAEGIIEYPLNKMIP